MKDTFLSNKHLTNKGAFKIVATPIKVVAGEDTGHGCLSLAGGHQPSTIINAPTNKVPQ